MSSRARSRLPFNAQPWNDPDGACNNRCMHIVKPLSFYCCRSRARSFAQSFSDGEFCLVGALCNLSWHLLFHKSVTRRKFHFALCVFKSGFIMLEACTWHTSKHRFSFRRVQNFNGLGLPGNCVKKLVRDAPRQLFCPVRRARRATVLTKIKFCNSQNTSLSEIKLHLCGRLSKPLPLRLLMRAFYYTCSANVSAWSEITTFLEEVESLNTKSLQIKTLGST